MSDETNQQNNIAQMEVYLEKVTVWSDHVNGSGYDAHLDLLTWENGKQALRLHCGGTAITLPYVFPYLKKDRL